MGSIEQELIAGRMSVAEWNQYLRNNPEFHPVLTGANLSGRDLKGIMLTHATLDDAVLEGADLHLADLRWSTFVRAKLSGARIRPLCDYPMNFDDADLRHADLERAKMCGFYGDSTAPITFPKIWLGSETALRALVSKGVTFRGADLRGAKVGRANFRWADFTGARLTGLVGIADFQGATLDDAEVYDTQLGRTLHCVSLKRVRLCNAQLQEVELIGANLEEADLSGADLSGAKLNGATLDRANLDGANLSHASFQAVLVRDPGEFRGYKSTDQFGNATEVGSYDRSPKANWEGPASLCGASLQGTNLAGADLRSVNLTEVDLSHANTSGAVFGEMPGYPDGGSPPQATHYDAEEKNHGTSSPVTGAGVVVLLLIILLLVALIIGLQKAPV